METCSTLLAFCAGNSPATGEFPTQRSVTRSFDVFVDLRWNRRLSKQLRRRWFETSLRLLKGHCNERFRERHCPRHHKTGILLKSSYYWSLNFDNNAHTFGQFVLRKIIFQNSHQIYDIGSLEAGENRRRDISPLLSPSTYASINNIENVDNKCFLWASWKNGNIYLQFE